MKPFGKSEEEINKLLSTVQLLSEEIGMDYKIEKCGVLITKGGKTGCTGGIWVMNKETTKELRDRRRIQIPWNFGKKQGKRIEKR